MALKFGIIGHGFMGHEHEKMLMNFDGIEVVAECDIDPDQLKDVPEGVKSYEKAEDLINDPDVEVVLVVANNNQHKKLVIQAAEAGKDVICEKPVAMSIEDLDEMKEACDKAGVKFTVHHQRRFDPDFRTAKEVYDSGTLGKLYTIQSSLYGYNGNMHDWHVIPEEGGGMLYDWGVHLIDQMLWMIPEKVTSVFANVRNVINKDVDDYFHIMLRFESGLVGEIELGTYVDAAGNEYDNYLLIALEPINFADYVG
jgi:predicted dehydrogenase